MTENKTHTLSKSDFKIARDCPQKLLYKKNDYPTNNDGNEFLQMLAEGGYIVGKMAQVMYEHFAKENGYACHEFTSKEKQKYAIEETEKWLKENEKVVLFEPAIKAGQKIIRIDILIKNGNHFQILEVKAKSHDSSNGDDEEDKKSDTKKKLKEYIEDVAYQKMVLAEWLEIHADDYPNPKIDSYLFMPDKSRYTQIDNLASWFEVSERIQIGNFNSIEVSFLKPGREKELWEEGNSILQKLDVNNDVETMMKDDIVTNTNNYLSILYKGFIEDREALISKKCFGCEFKNPDNPEKDGYGQCLDKRAYAENHISELYFGGSIGGKNNPLVDSKLKVNKTLTIFDFDVSEFKTTKGLIGSRNERQIIQYTNTQENKEFFHEDMADYLQDWQFPLHFIDFETLTCAIPHHKGMRPYEMIAFQWSCHTIEKPGDEPIHSEWINTEPTFPNFRFAESLMKQIGTNGTPLMWATHENTVLKGILGQLENVDQYQPGYKNEPLKEWLLDITKRKGEKNKVINEGRLIDMNDFTLKNYFHPYMKGKTSIKKTLPAVWNHNPYLHEVPYFKTYYKLGEDGHVLNPYETLKYHWDLSEFEKAEMNETVKEGSAAMRAYQEMLFGKGQKDAQTKERLKQELLNYCKLDTMAMIMIWKHWVTHLKLYI